MVPVFDSVNTNCIYPPLGLIWLNVMFCIYSCRVGGLDCTAKIINKNNQSPRKAAEIFVNED